VPTGCRLRRQGESCARVRADAGAGRANGPPRLLESPAYGPEIPLGLVIREVLGPRKTLLNFLSAREKLGGARPGRPRRRRSRTIPLNAVARIAATGLAAAALALAAATAQPNASAPVGYEAHFESKPEGPTSRFHVDGVDWRCMGTRCIGKAGAPGPAGPDACKSLARKLGAPKSFSRNGNPLGKRFLRQCRRTGGSRMAKKPAEAARASVPSPKAGPRPVREPAAKPRGEPYPSPKAGPLPTATASTKKRSTGRTKPSALRKRRTPTKKSPSTVTLKTAKSGAKAEEPLLRAMPVREPTQTIPSASEIQPVIRQLVAGGGRTEIVGRRFGAQQGSRVVLKQKTRNSIRGGGPGQKPETFPTPAIVIRWSDREIVVSNDDGQDTYREFYIADSSGKPLSNRTGVTNDNRRINECDYVADADGDGTVNPRCGGDDCDDNDPRRFPNAVEVCDADGLDEDCDPTTFGIRDTDADGFVDHRCWNRSPSGREARGRDCDDFQAGVHPNSPEVCDGRDNNCDGYVDEGVSFAIYRDADRDLYGSSQEQDMACYAPSGWSTNADDCNDDDPLANPRSPERPGDGMDNDCDGQVDE